MEATNPLYKELGDLLNIQSSVGWSGKLLKQKWSVLLLTLLVLAGLLYFLLAEILPMVSVRMINIRQESALGKRIYQSAITESEIDSFAITLTQRFAD